MKIEQVNTYEDLEQYLREFTNFFGEPAPYDFNGAFQLFLAILQNLSRHYHDTDIDSLEDLQGCFNSEQLRFLSRLEQLRNFR